MLDLGLDPGLDPEPIMVARGFASGLLARTNQSPFLGVGLVLIPSTQATWARSVPDVQGSTAMAYSYDRIGSYFHGSG